MYWNKSQFPNEVQNETTKLYTREKLTNIISSKGKSLKLRRHQEIMIIVSFWALLYSNYLMVHVSEPANLVKKIISATMATLHLKNLYNHPPKTFPILQQRFKSAHFLFSIKRWPHCDHNILQKRNHKSWIHLWNIFH